MGLFDSVLGNILGGGANGKGIDYIAIMQWVEQQGGLQAILDKFRRGSSAISSVPGSAMVKTSQLPAITYSRRWVVTRSINWLKNWVLIRPRPPAPLHSSCQRSRMPPRQMAKCNKTAMNSAIWSANCSNNDYAPGVWPGAFTPLIPSIAVNACCRCATQARTFSGIKRKAG